jgi:hypothetical protein
MVLGRERQSILTPRGDFHFPRQFNRLSLHAYGGAGCFWAEVAGVRTGVARRFLGEARKGFGLTVALGPWAWGLRCRRTHGGGVAGPRPLEHEAQPHQGDEP